jgi:hypothetical protein
MIMQGCTLGTPSVSLFRVMAFPRVLHVSLPSRLARFSRGYYSEFSAKRTQALTRGRIVQRQILVTAGNHAPAQSRYYFGHPRGRVLSPSSTTHSYI